MVLVEPTITVRVNDDLELVLFTDERSPPGVVWKVRTTVFGSRRRVLVSVRPPESVAVSFSSRYDGYSWSGAAKDPLATPAKVCSGCVWQLDGQCCRIQLPGQRRRRQRAVLRIGGRAGEADHIAHLPGGAGQRRVDDGGRRSVANRDGDRVGVRGPQAVGHSQRCGVAAGSGVGVARLRGRRVVVRTVAVQVPRVGQRVAVRVARTGAVEGHRQRRRHRWSGSQWPSATGGWFAAV